MEDIEVRHFVVDLIDNTKRKKVQWKKVPKKELSALLDRSIVRSNVKEAYYATNHSSNVSVGRLEITEYYDEDETYVTDRYFISFTDMNFNNVVTFFDKDISCDDLDTLLARLYRIIKMEYSGIEKTIKEWFK